MLKLRDVSLERGERKLFAGLATEIDPGRLHLATGGNGTGKTSLLKLMAGLLEPDAGQVLWEDEDLAASDGSWRRDVLLLSHKGGFKLDLTPVENLQLAQALAGGEPWLAADAACERLGLADHNDRPCRDLSAGQRRRLGLARLLLNRARLWLLDEPFANLDAAGRSLLLELLDAHLGGGGGAVVTSHVDIDWPGPAAARIELEPAP